MKFLKSCKFTLNLHFQSFQSDLFEKWFLLIHTRWAEIFTIIISSYSSIVTNWQIHIKFWDGSCASLKSFAPFGRNDCGGSCSEKNVIREYRQKTLIMLSKFWPLSGCEDLSESVKKGNFLTKMKNYACWYKS